MVLHGRIRGVQVALDLIAAIAVSTPPWEKSATAKVGELGVDRAYPMKTNSARNRRSSQGVTTFNCRCITLYLYAVAACQEAAAAVRLCVGCMRNLLQGTEVREVCVKGDT